MQGYITVSTPKIAPQRVERRTFDVSGTPEERYARMLEMAKNENARAKKINGEYVSNSSALKMTANSRTATLILKERGCECTGVVAELMAVSFEDAHNILVYAEERGMVKMEGGKWHFLRTAAKKIKRSKTHSEMVLNALRENEGATAVDLAAIVGLTTKQTSSALKNLKQHGRAENIIIAGMGRGAKYIWRAIR